MGPASHILITTASILFLGAAPSDARKLTVDDFYGNWVAIKTEGKGAANRSIHMALAIENGGKWVIVSQVKSPGNINRRTDRGSYRLEKNDLILTRSDAKPMKASLAGNDLTLQDPNLNVNIQFRRVGPP